MTTYLLNSGGIRNSVDKGKKFFSEMVKGLGSHPHILLCLFAQPREDWEAKYPEYVEFITAVLPDSITPVFSMALPDTFVEQNHTADAVYLPGGDDRLIQYWLRQFDLPNIWKGKVVGTNSASSHALTKHFWTCDWRQCMDGLGVLPIKFIAHYKSEYGKDDPRGPIDWAAAYRQLEEYGDPTLPIHALPEGEYITIQA